MPAIFYRYLIDEIWTEGRTRCRGPCKITLILNFMRCSPSLVVYFFVITKYFSKNVKKCWHHECTQTNPRRSQLPATGGSFLPFRASHAGRNLCRFAIPAVHQKIVGPAIVPVTVDPRRAGVASVALLFCCQENRQGPAVDPAGYHSRRSGPVHRAFRPRFQKQSCARQISHERSVNPAFGNQTVW
jgi:hypothetical protein